MASGKVSHVFAVKNTGTEPVVIEKIYTSCMCTAATLTKGERTFGPFSMPSHGFIPKIGMTLESGEEAAIEAVFDPAAHGPAGVGLAERVVYLETNAAKSPTLELTFRASVIR